MFHQEQNQKFQPDVKMNQPRSSGIPTTITNPWQGTPNHNQPARSLLTQSWHCLCPFPANIKRARCIDVSPFSGMLLDLCMVECYLHSPCASDVSSLAHHQNSSSPKDLLVHREHMGHMVSCLGLCVVSAHALRSCAAYIHILRSTVDFLDQGPHVDIQRTSLPETRLSRSSIRGSFGGGDTSSHLV